MNYYQLLFVVINYYCKLQNNNSPYIFDYKIIISFYANIVTNIAIYLTH